MRLVQSGTCAEGRHASFRALLIHQSDAACTLDRLRVRPMSDMDLPAAHLQMIRGTGTAAAHASYRRSDGLVASARTQVSTSRRVSTGQQSVFQFRYSGIQRLNTVPVLLHLLLMIPVFGLRLLAFLY